MFLQHPELMIELLSPERGRGNDGVTDLPALGMNAQPLRFMDVALMNTLKLYYEDIPVILPHPAAFALHKLLIAPRRQNPAKKQKDLDAALAILDLIEKKGAYDDIRLLMTKFPEKWKTTIFATLHQFGREELAKQLTV